MKVTVDLKFKKGDVVWGYFTEDGYCVFYDKIGWVQFDENDCTKLLYGLDRSLDAVPDEGLFKTPEEACAALAEAIRKEIGR